MRSLVTANIEQLRPYAPGKPIEETEREYGVKNPAKLASNENPLGPSPKAVAAMQAMVWEMHLYPDGGCYFLKERLAEHLAHYSVEPHNLIVGNGSNEVIEFLIRTFVAADENIVTAAPSFIIYRLAAIAHGRREISVPLREDLSYDLNAIARAVDPKTKLICLANPNNPTGRAFNKEEFERFLTQVREDIVICLDEAYAEYIEDPSVPDGLNYARFRHRLVVLRTFSKIYGLAGLRLGYGACGRELVQYMDRVRPPFNVNRMAQAAAIAALDDQEFVLKVRELNSKSRVYLEGELSRLGVKWYPSQANFVLADFGKPGQPIYEALLRRGFITRTVANYGLPTCLRISTGTEEQNRGLISALEEVLEEVQS